jgi:hypothetical protein
MPEGGSTAPTASLPPTGQAPTSTNNVASGENQIEEPKEFVNPEKKTRNRLTNAEKEAEKIKLELEHKSNPSPEGYIPNYMEGKTKKNGGIEYKNKQGQDVLGKGGWNWYQGQMGPEAEKNWLHQFGRTNQSYADVQQAIKEGRLKGPTINEKGRGGSFPREPHVPNYIKGSASIGGMASTGLGSLGALMAAHNIKNDLENAKEAEKNNDIPLRNAHYRNIFSNIPILGDLMVDSPEQYEFMREQEKKKKAK